MAIPSFIQVLLSGIFPRLLRRTIGRDIDLQSTWEIALLSWFPPVGKVVAFRPLDNDFYS